MISTPGQHGWVRHAGELYPSRAAANRAIVEKLDAIAGSLFSRKYHHTRDAEVAS